MQTLITRPDYYEHNKIMYLKIFSVLSSMGHTPAMVTLLVIIYLHSHLKEFEIEIRLLPFLTLFVKCYRNKLVQIKTNIKLKL